jgi:purine-binding chemotaxis protein CheW
MAEDLSLKGSGNEDTQKDKYLTFHLAGEDYGIEICYVIEIIGIQSITEVPDMPDFIRGVINLRGKVIPVMDVRARFRLPARDYDDRTCIIVINVDATEVGLVVDEVSEVADIPESDVEPAPRTSKNSDNSYIQGMGKMNKRVIILLEVQKLLFSGAMQHLIETDGDEE